MSTKPPPLPDENHDWEEHAKTTLDEAVIVEAVPLAAREPVTAPHDVAPLAAGLELEIAKARDEGYRKGFAAGTERQAKAVYEEGQKDIMDSARNVMLSKGLTNDETTNLLALFWQGRTKL